MAGLYPPLFYSGLAIVGVTMVAFLWTFIRRLTPSRLEGELYLSVDTNQRPKGAITFQRLAFILEAIHLIILPFSIFQLTWISDSVNEPPSWSEAPIPIAARVILLDPTGDSVIHLWFVLFGIMALYFLGYLAALYTHPRYVSFSSSNPRLAKYMSVFFDGEGFGPEIAFLFLSTLFLPVTRGAARYMACPDGSDSPLSAAPGITCWSGPHIALFAVSLFVMMVYLAYAFIVFGMLQLFFADAHNFIPPFTLVLSLHRFLFLFPLVFLPDFSLTVSTISGAILSCTLVALTVRYQPVMYINGLERRLNNSIVGVSVAASWTWIVAVYISFFTPFSYWPLIALIPGWIILPPIAALLNDPRAKKAVYPPRCPALIKALQAAILARKWPWWRRRNNYVIEMAAVVDDPALMELLTEGTTVAALITGVKIHMNNNAVRAELIRRLKAWQDVHPDTENRLMYIKGHVWGPAAASTMAVTKDSSAQVLLPLDPSETLSYNPLNPPVPQILSAPAHSSDITEPASQSRQQSAPTQQEPPPHPGTCSLDEALAQGMTLPPRIPSLLHLASVAVVETMGMEWLDESLPMEIKESLMVMTHVPPPPMAAFLPPVHTLTALFPARPTNHVLRSAVIASYMQHLLAKLADGSLTAASYRKPAPGPSSRTPNRKGNQSASAPSTPQLLHPDDDGWSMGAEPI